MKVRDLLETVRHHYLEHFEATIETSRRPGSRILIEKALRKAADDGTNGEGEGGDVLARTPRLGLPFRADMYVFPEEGEPREILVDPSRMLGFEPFALEWQDGLEVEIHPFVWSRLGLELSGVDPSELDDPNHPLCRALIGWFDEGFEASTPREGTFLGVVHSLSDPEPSTRERDSSSSEDTEGRGQTTDTLPGARFLIDLGTAPVATLLALFDALASAGIGRARIGLVVPEENSPTPEPGDRE